MTDVFTDEKRSWVMSRIRSKNTSPEMKVRSMLHRMGYRFRLHRRDLPGTPDIVLPMYKTVILVHGCFWHHHNGCRFAYIPKSRTEFWRRKLESNAARDERAAVELGDLGWHVEVVWECELASNQKADERIQSLLSTLRHRVDTSCFNNLVNQNQVKLEGECDLKQEIATCLPPYQC